jgi:hypothetical protein
MSTYCYTLRKPTKKVLTIEGPIFVPEFKFAYGNAGSWNTDRKTEAIRSNQLNRASDAFDHHAGPVQYKECKYCEGGRRYYRHCICTHGRVPLTRTVLALDGEFLVRTRRSHYLDGPSLEDIHEEVIGKVVREGRDLILVRTADMSKDFTYPGTRA